MNKEQFINKWYPKELQELKDKDAGENTAIQHHLRMYEKKIMYDIDLLISQAIAEHGHGKTVIKAKALRWKYTGEWCFLNENGLWEGRPYPDIASSLTNETPDTSELVDITIIIEP